GISAPAGTRLAIVETDNKHPFVQKELLMPVLAVVKAKDFEEALEFAVDAEHGFGHTAMIHSRCTDNVTKFIKTMKVTIAVQNGSSYNGLGVGTGPTTFTVAGPTGEGITTPRHFVKYRRIAIASGGYYTR
ncbi:MAG: aldehyde dehydrogenase family protein, partial [Defluviitaleaceae bacterium]|nr:aldehyde dehydrogenase family protein [Defluviitaleaceae bacterium]